MSVLVIYIVQCNVSALNFTPNLNQQCTEQMVSMSCLLLPVGALIQNLFLLVLGVLGRFTWLQNIIMIRFQHHLI